MVIIAKKFLIICPASKKIIQFISLKIEILPVDGIIQKIVGGFHLKFCKHVSCHVT